MEKYVAAGGAVVAAVATYQRAVAAGKASVAAASASAASHDLFIRLSSTQLIALTSATGEELTTLRK